MPGDSLIWKEGCAVGHYKILSHLASGGMGEVYLAEDSRLIRKVVLKILPQKFTQDTERIRRFFLEARASSALNHPNILTVHDVGQIEDTHFIVNEYVEGDTLRKRISQGKLELREVLDISIQTASGLTAAHEAGVLHRDIKPDNIMLRRDGLVKILDFGLAKLIQQGETISSAMKTESGLVLGTPDHMSPEQARGQEVDARTDIFSLGVVLYEMTARKRAFTGDTVADVIVSILNAEPVPVSVLAPETPSALEQIIQRALRKIREERYQTTREFLNDLTHLKRRIDADAQAGLREPRVSSIQTQIYSGGQRLRAIAVLPFRPINAETRDEYLELGIADALITRLSDLKQVVVRPTSAIRKYIDVERDPITAGRELAVESVVEGSIRKIGDRIRITARLIGVEDGRSLWAGKFDENFTDIFDVEDSISERVAASLALTLSNEERERLTKRYTENVDAYHLYLKGRYYCNKRSAAGLNKSIECFRKALEIEPNYAPAYSGLADAYIYLGDAGITAMSTKEAFAKGRAAAEKALEIDDALAETHASLAHLHLHHFEWAEAEKEFKRAFELKPNYASAHQIYAYYLLFMGRPEEASAEINRAIELDPLSIPINADKGSFFFYMRRYDEAIEQYRKTLEMEADAIGVRLNLARAYEQKQMFDQAIAECETAAKLSDRNTGSVASLAHACVLAGRRSEAIALIKELNEITQSRQKYASPYDLAVVYAALGDHDIAFQFLEQAYAERSEWIIYLSVDPRLDPLRADPRFGRLIRAMGLAPRSEDI